MAAIRRISAKIGLIFFLATLGCGRTQGERCLPPAITIAGSGVASGPAAYLFVTARDSADGWSNGQIYLTDANFGLTANLTKNAYSNGEPSVSPDGTRIAFTSSRDHGNQIYVMNVDGSDVHMITSFEGGASGPRWSPTGQLGFQAPPNAVGTSVYIVDDDGGNAVRITFPGENESDDAGIAFVDGGRAVVFSRYDHVTRDRDLWMVAVDGATPAQRLTQTKDTSEMMPVVSHDGRLLAYRAFHPSPQTHETIGILQVGTVGLGTFALVKELALPSPVRFNVSGIDFTADDRGFVFGADASDVGGTLQNLHGEIFTLDLEGTHLVRGTRNAQYDGQPASLAPRLH
jgi:dipeptidyl aminopeptidase/acylaminoacyl peptidase